MNFETATRRPQDGASLGGSIGIAPIKKETAFDHVGELCAFAYKLANRAEALEDKLLGAKPRNGESCSETCDGVFPHMSQSVLAARGRLGDVMAALDAIERALP